MGGAFSSNCEVVGVAEAEAEAELKRDIKGVIC